MKKDIIAPLVKVKDLERREYNGKIYESREIWLDNSFNDFKNYVAVVFKGKHLNDPNYFNVGDKVKVWYDIDGRPYADKKTGEEKIFTTLVGLGIENVEQPAAAKPAVTKRDDDLPF